MDSRVMERRRSKRSHRHGETGFLRGKSDRRAEYEGTPVPLI